MDRLNFHHLLLIAKYIGNLSERRFSELREHRADTSSPGCYRVLDLISVFKYELVCNGILIRDTGDVLAAVWVDTVEGVGRAREGAHRKSLGLHQLLHVTTYLIVNNYIFLLSYADAPRIPETRRLAGHVNTHSLLHCLFRVTAHTYFCEPARFCKTRDVRVNGSLPGGHAGHPWHSKHGEEHTSTISINDETIHSTVVCRIMQDGPEFVVMLLVQSAT